MARRKKHDDGGGLGATLQRGAIGVAAGVVGTLVLGFIMLATWGIVGPSFGAETVINEFGIASEERAVHPMFLWFAVLAMFLSGLGANLLFVILLTVTEAKYEHRATAITHVFSGMIFFLVLALPVYLLASGMFGPEGIAVAALLHAVCMTLLTGLLLEILHGRHHLMVSAYGFTLGLMLFGVGYFVLARVTDVAPAALVLGLYPLLLGLLHGGNAAAEGMYHALYEAYGSDFLDVRSRFGSDYSESQSADEAEEEDWLDEEV